MSVTATTLPRVFKYQGTEFPDPGPGLSPDDALAALATAHPALNNALLEGSEIKDGKQVFAVKVAAGTKG